MKTIFRNIPWLALLATVAAVFAGFGFVTKAADGGEPNRPAPAWVLKDVNGNEVRSEEFKGKVVVLDFWATWCGPCRVEIPGYVALQKKYADKGLAVVGVSLDQQGPGVVRRFIEQNGVTYPIVVGDQAMVDAFGGVDAIPTTFIIDRDGNIRHRKVGAMHTEQFEKILRPVLE